MFRAWPSDLTYDPRLQRLFEMVKEEFFAVNQTAAAVNFAAIEDCAHQVGRKVARLSCVQVTSRCAEFAEHPQACPKCVQLSSGIIEKRPLETRNGPVLLKEAWHYCSQYRRGFFPQ